jgi:hypothetical protein
MNFEPLDPSQLDTRDHQMTTLSLPRPNGAAAEFAFKRLAWQVPAWLVLVSVCLATGGCGSATQEAKSRQSKPQQVKPQVAGQKRDSAKTATNQTNRSVAKAAGDEPGLETTDTAADSEIDIPEITEIKTVYRPSDSRPAYDDKKLAQRGFSKVKSERLMLYSDLPAEELTGLPELADDLYPALEDYFGALPPDRERRPYQMTAFLMAEPQRFIDAGLVSEQRVQPHEGWYRGNEFWWNRQATEYYTRHLLLHEATHCFMHVMPPVDCPPWYVEGMAELFGTHQRNEGKTDFGVMPRSPDQCPGWGRISVIQQEVKEGRLLDVDQILAFTFNDFQKVSAYAWSWALCHYLNEHPRYQKPFHKLAKRLMDGRFERHTVKLLEHDMPQLRDEWLLFASQLQYGHDIARSEIDFQQGAQLGSDATSKPMTISPQRGWQAAGVTLLAGRTYQISASGRVTLVTTTKPWISEPQGISIRYFAGQPIGRLLGCIRPDPVSSQSTSDTRDILKVIPLGPKSTFKAIHTGTLYLRVNDAWNELSDNSGEFQVTIKNLGNVSK